MILTVTFDVIKFLVLEWETISYRLLSMYSNFCSLSEKLFHIDLIGPSFSSSNLLLHSSGSDRSVRLVRPVCLETVSRGPLIGRYLKLPMDFGSSDHISEVPTCTASYLHHSQIVLTWCGLGMIWKFSLTNKEHSQLYVRLQIHSKNMLVPKTQIVKWSLLLIKCIRVLNVF